MRWPSKIKAGTVNNNIGSHEDMLPTILAAAGEPDIKEKLLKGHTAIGRDYNVHLDGYNLLPSLTGKAEWPRREFFYWTDDGNLCALRYDRWKLVFLEQRAHGFHVWEEPLIPLRLPKLFCLRTDPFERADHEAEGYGNWRLDRVFLAVPAQAFVAKHLETYKEFPPRQEPGSFSLDQVLRKLQESSNK
jgi:arylsulfatase